MQPSENSEDSQHSAHGKASKTRDDLVYSRVEGRAEHSVLARTYADAAGENGLVAYTELPNLSCMEHSSPPKGGIARCDALA
jgi:hypothetical protein